VLEVSSPGIDRPIRSADDFRRNTGRRIVVTARDGEGAECSRTGKLLGCEEGALLLETEGGEQRSIPLERVVHARQEASL
jgi:ribosome maturation factor RimP